MAESDFSAGWFIMCRAVTGYSLHSFFILSLPRFHRIIFRGSLRWDLSPFSIARTHTHTHLHTQTHKGRYRQLSLSRSINCDSEALLLQIFSLHSVCLTQTNTHRHTHTHAYKKKWRHKEWRDGTSPCVFTSPVISVNYACRGSLLGRWSGLGGNTHTLTHTHADKHIHASHHRYSQKVTLHHHHRNHHNAT